MNRNNSSNKYKSSNIVLKIGITYIIPIFLAICGAIMISRYAWYNIFERCYFSSNNISQNIKNTEYEINGRKLWKPYIYQQFAKLSINSVDINDADIYEGYNDKALKLGIGHYLASTIPGENGMTTLIGYSSMEFGKLKNIKNGDQVIIETTYGKYYYKVQGTTTVLKNNVQFYDYGQKKEKLVMYTDYPFDTIGETNQYFVVSCEFEKVE